MLVMAKELYGDKIKFKMTHEEEIKKFKDALKKFSENFNLDLHIVNLPESKENIDSVTLYKQSDIDEFMNKKDKFILNYEREVIPASLLEWEEYFENSYYERIVKRTELNGLRRKS